MMKEKTMLALRTVLSLVWQDEEYTGCDGFLYSTNEGAVTAVRSRSTYDNRHNLWRRTARGLRLTPAQTDACRLLLKEGLGDASREAVEAALRSCVEASCSSESPFVAAVPLALLMAAAVVAALLIPGVPLGAILVALGLGGLLMIWLCAREAEAFFLWEDHKAAPADQLLPALRRIRDLCGRPRMSAAPLVLRIVLAAVTVAGATHVILALAGIL